MSEVKDTAEKNEQYFKFKADSILTEIKQIEYLQQNKFEVTLGKTKWTDESKKIDKEVIGWQLQIVVVGKVPEVFYVRNFPGETEESRYYVIFFSFKDILNNGIRLFHLLYEDQKALLNQMIEKQKGKIIA